MTKESKETVPLKMHATHDSIVDMTDEFCQSHLTDEYAELCRKLAAQLTRKRPSPLERGRPKSWTGAILYTIARVNFLFDPNQTPHMSASQLCELVGVSQGTASAKSTQIMDMLCIIHMHLSGLCPASSMRIRWPG
jgi:hypothetical protein